MKTDELNSVATEPNSDDDNTPIDDVANIIDDMPGRTNSTRNRLKALQDLGFGEKSIVIPSPYKTRRVGEFSL